jgi:hypothetical protein
MPDLTNPSTIAQQTQQALGNVQNSISGAGSTVLNDASGAIQGVVGGIAGKLSAAGSSITGAASAAFNQLGSAVSTVTKFKDTLGVAEKIREIRPEGTRGKVTQGARQYQFPLDLGHYYIKFSFKSAYQPNPVFKRQEINEAVIFLPLPSELSERYSVQYAEKQLGMAGLLEESGLLKSAQEMLGGTMTKEKAAAAGQKLGNLAGGPGNLAYLARSGIKSISDNAGAAIDRATGSVLNPYQALQFQGIDLRSHSFRFRCSPNSEAEAAALKTIIRELKIRMLPEKTGLLFNFPDICTIEFQTRDMPYSFKNCYLKSMSVNYAPQGTPSFFKGGKYTTEAEISLEFGEVEPVTRNDVQAGDLTQPLGQNSSNKPIPVTTEGKVVAPSPTPPPARTAVDGEGTFTTGVAP